MTNPIASFYVWLIAWLQLKWVSKLGHILATAVFCLWLGSPLGWKVFSFAVEGTQFEGFISEEWVNHSKTFPEAFLLWFQRQFLETAVDVFLWNFLGMRLAILIQQLSQ